MMNQELFTVLFKKYTSRTCTKAERDQFFNQIRQNQNNKLMNNLMDELYREIKENEQKPVRQLKLRSVVYRFSAAAIWTVVILLPLFYALYTKTVPTKKEDYKLKLAGNVLKTLKTQQNYLLLPDSTQVWMNSSTDLRYPKKFDNYKREIYLEGEAFLDVKHAEDIPFIIHMPGKIAVTVLGTAFNIKTSEETGQAVVSVKRGKVRVSKGEQVLSTLIVGEELQINLLNNSILRKKVDIDEVNSWQKSNVYFNDSALKDIIKYVNEHKNTKITIENEKLANIIINIGFKKDETVSGILDVIKAITDCKVVKENEAYRLY